MTIAPGSGVTKSGNMVTIPYSISGTNSGKATQVSVLILDKKYTEGNTNGAKVLAYDKLNVENCSTTGTGTYTLPDSLSGQKAGTDYHMYILAEDVNGEKETDYASEPVEIYLWEAPTVKQMNFGTQGIIDPAVPNSASDAWKGCYVYYGNYDADGNETTEPVKYRVLDANTTDYSADGTTQTMLLDCDSILFKQIFDDSSNVWADSDVKNSLNGDGFLNKEGVFTTAEKNAIAASTVDTHVLTTDYVALTGEQIFLLDAEDVSNGAYGYSMTNTGCENRKKTGSSAAYWWLRSADDDFGNSAGCVDSDGDIRDDGVSFVYPGVSPALNLNLSSVIFSSASGTSKSSALGSGSAEIDTEANTGWKLTLKDDEKSVALTEGRSVTKASDGTITVPYTYTDKENATEKEKVNQISVMITDKAYDAEKAANAQEAQILYYGALQDVTTEDEVMTSAGTGTFALPSGLTGTLGTDYHIYLLAEHVNDDKSTDYASEPKEVTTILNEVDSVAVRIDTPIAEEPLKEEITVSSTGVAEKATLAWKKDDTEATGNAEWKTTYQAYVTLTAADEYTFMDATGNIASVTLNGQSVDTENITLNADGTLTVYCGEYTTAKRKTESATAPEVPTQFANYYTADNVLSSTELGTTAKVTLEGSTEPNSEEMEVEWSVVDANGESEGYDATPAAFNTFKWTVKESEYADYDKGVAVLEGTVTIQNKDYTPVTITGEDVPVTYNGEDKLDVSQYFTIDENAGTPTYELLDSSTGSGEWEGSTLKMTTLGTFVIKVSTLINGVYDKGENTLTITVNKATPNVTALATVADRIYHPSTVLAGTDITGGTVKDVSGNTLAGTWSWKEADVVPTVDNDGYVAVFTPEDTVHYESVEKTISVNVSKAAPYIKTAPTATAITYGEALSVSTLKDAVVWYSESDEEAIEGTFTWKEAATKPVVADSNKTEYVLVFTPTDAENYNTVETKLTLTVNKAKVAPNKPESTMNTVYTNETVGKVTLPEGWVWQDSDKTKALEAGKAVTATAIYNGADKGNYVTESVEVSITRQACTHSGETETKDKKEATCGAEGYTGDTYCKTCEERIAFGEVIEKKAHVYGEPKFTWSADGKSCTVTFTCENDATHTDTQDATVTSEVKTIATCKDMGTTTYKATYTDKDKVYTDEGKTYSATKDVVDIPVDAANHTGETEVKDAKEATCGEEGYTGDTYCKACGNKKADGDAIAKTEHTYGEPEFTWSEDGKSCKVTFTCENDVTHTDTHEANVTSKVKTAATCKDKGTTTYKATYTDEDKIYTDEGKTYSDTKDVVDIPVDVAKHEGEREVKDAKEATCAEEGYTGDTYCKACGDKIGAGTKTDKLTEHTWDEGVVTKEATTTEQGEKTYTCSVCETTKTEEIPVKSDSETPGVNECNHEESDILYTGNGETAPTCTEAGIGHTECTKCNEVMQSNVAVEAIGHNGGTATCSQNAICETCNDEYGEKNISNHTGETEVKNAKEATCGAEGYTGDTYCKACGTKKADGAKIDKLTTHTWDAGVVTKEATATEKGEKTYTCSVCKTTKKEEIPALGVPKVGEQITSDNGATYKVTATGENSGSITYVEPADKKATTVVIPATITIDNITYKVTKISDTAFAGNKNLTSVTIGNNVTGISAKTFMGCTNLKTLTIGNGVTSIPANAFKSFKKLVTVKMGTGVKSIGKDAFNGCSKLKNVTIGKNVTSIGDKAFYKCTALTKVSLPDKIKTIGKQAFYGCKNVTSVTIGKNVTTIGSKAFYGCSKIKTLTIKSTKLTTKKTGSSAFGKTPKSMTVKAPTKKWGAYKSMLIKRGVNKNAKFKKI